MKARFRYFNDRKGKRKYTVAWFEDLVGIAMCHKDDKFNKKRGREIATGRLVIKPGRLPQNGNYMKYNEWLEFIKDKKQFYFSALKHTER